MKAVVFNDKDGLRLDTNYPKPVPQKGEALIKVNLAGICNTDFEITKGYMGYNGILGHEFVGVVEEINSEDQSLLGKRVVAESVMVVATLSVSGVHKRITDTAQLVILLGLLKKTVVLLNI